MKLKLCGLCGLISKRKSKNKNKKQPNKADDLYEFLTEKIG